MKTKTSTPGATPVSYPSISPAEVKLQRAAGKRRDAAFFIQTTLGQSSPVPHHSDQVFRAYLADGAILCHLLNALKPGTISYIVEDHTVASPAAGVRQVFENVGNFLEALPLFTTETFSAADLEASGDAPQVVETILSLKDWQHATLEYSFNSCSISGTPAPTLPSPDVFHHTETPVTLQKSHLTPSQCELGGPHETTGYTPTGYTPAAEEIVARHRYSSDGLTYLMQSCTHMLKTRMGMPATPLPPPPSSSTTPEIALDAVGPVLETVLSNLTSEYERRLLAKDHEYKARMSVIDGLKQQVASLEAEVEHWKKDAQERDAVKNAETEALRVQERTEYERLQHFEAALIQELKEKKVELAAAERSAARAASDAVDEISLLQAQLARYQEMESKFKAIKAENRELYNTVQDLRGSIRVFCRVRPVGVTGDGSRSVVEVGEDGALAVYSSKHSKWHEFTFDRVFGEDSTQEEIYKETKPLTRSVLDGFNVCIFAYGQTGSGKTWTMTGTQDYDRLDTPEDLRGINFRALEDLFQQREDRSDETVYTVKVQLLEIYNESIRDLLCEDDTKSLTLVATKGSGSNVPEATQIQVSCAAHVFEILEQGGRNRATSETCMNERSSRSHQVLTVMVDGCNVVNHTRTFGCLHLIDLAGSERVSRSGASGQQLTEAQHINKSLSALGNVMQALAQKREYIPFRDSKLTQLLADSLAGQAKTMMFMHVAPESSSSLETLSTLNFGHSVTAITLGAAKKNVESGAVWEAKGLKEQLIAAQKQAAEERARREQLERQLRELQDSSDSLTNESASIPAYNPRRNSSLSQEAPAGSRRLSSPSGGLARPPQVARLNLSKLSTPGSADGKLDTSRIPSSVASARGATSKIPTPVLSRVGSLTARPARNNGAFADGVVSSSVGSVALTPRSSSLRRLSSGTGERRQPSTARRWM